MKISSFKNVIVPLLFVGEVFFFGSAALAAGNKAIIGYGWDFLEATTEDVFRNRAKFADSGVDGVLMSVDGVKADGSRYQGRRVMSNFRMRETDFSRSLDLLKEITLCKGLRESMALMLMTPAKRIKWEDDASWSVISNNVTMIARMAKRGGMKGVAIDHEDYFKARQFNRKTDDPSGVWEKARQRGREVFGGLFAEFPDAKVLGFWMFSDGGMLWRAFLNGMLDVIPPTARFIDGNENYGYQAMADEGDFRADTWYILQTLRNGAVVPENRSKYDCGVSVSFGQYIDAYLSKDASSTYFIGPMNGSRIERLEDNLAAAVRYSGDLVWIYGERGTWVDWDKKHHSKLKPMQWQKRIPGFTRALRVAAGDPSAIDGDVASGRLVNLIVNSDCDSKDGKSVPKPFCGWSRLKDPPPEGIFSYDPSEGGCKKGCLKLQGDGCYCAGVRGLIPGEAVYVRMKIKGKGSASFDWQSGKQRLWYTNRGTLFPVRNAPDEKGWRTEFVRLTVPERVNALNLVLGSGTGDEPIWFDDIEVFVRPR